MDVVTRLKQMFGIRERDEKAPVREDRPPTVAETQTALETVRQLAKPAIFGEIGGEKPDKENRARSWWGANFLAAENETIPVCTRSGRPLHPLVQIRIDELPQIPPLLSGMALMTIWIDPEEVPLHDAIDGQGFAIRTYPSLDNLVPIGPGYRETEIFPSFPLLWRAVVDEQPSWEDTAFKIPDSVARSDDMDWFFDSRFVRETEPYRMVCPVKLGGWPTWIQGADWPKEAKFCLQIDSTEKGRFGVGDGGSIYLFRTPAGWALRADFF
ncbi:DUF1963 domain-containing protein [Neorhizobium alkalisoli]|uniref:Uncharacterized protein YwqG n=1 Tax=Neorhizobium alkalisoli TaxID=528178 RepID=A0A561QW94_9HYPH|nr:DUF1963 domain-containing protein [Neorhizobium alkalisoli]TWF54612.1 uncharacterized protein YwqG [Neorhizobium alkalisoli]